MVEFDADPLQSVWSATSTSEVVIEDERRCCTRCSQRTYVHHGLAAATSGVGGHGQVVGGMSTPQA